MFEDLRKKVDMTQKEVADEFGYSSAQFISNIERDIAPFPLKHILKIAKIYKVTPEVIIEALTSRYRARVMKYAYGKTRTRKPKLK